MMFMILSNLNKLVIMPIYTISPFILISLNSWFSMWVILELNNLTFITLMIFMNKNSYMHIMKYFLIQTLASLIMIFFFNTYMTSYSNPNFFFSTMINLSLMIKLGAAPFHSWFMDFMLKMSWPSCLMISTWQKIMPLYMIQFNEKNMIMYFIATSIIISSIMGLNQNNCRMIMAFSSINNLGWLMMNMVIFENMWILYFIIYFSSNASIMWMFNNLKINYLNNMYKFSNNIYSMKFILWNMLSLSGLPPFPSFSMKWLTIQFMMENKLNLMSILMLSFSILTFFFYMRLIWTMLLWITPVDKKLTWKKKIKNKLLFMPLISIFINLWLINFWFMT